MDKLLIRGGKPLPARSHFRRQERRAARAVRRAADRRPVTLQNVPRLQDVATMLKLIRNMGVTAERGDDGTVRIDAGKLSSPEAPYELVKTMRASVLALGPLLARFGEATVSLPGGCAIGSRPVDQHIKGLQAMGAEIVVEHGYMIAKLPARRAAAPEGRQHHHRHGDRDRHRELPDGRQRWPRARPCWKTRRRSPRSSTWPKCSSSMGAKIEGHGTSRIRIQGVEKLHGCTHQRGGRPHRGRHLPVRRGGRRRRRGAAHGRADHLDAVIDKLRDAG
jgi:UDP-N-acetylglucosamine 1-carboxyvinyltransferase